MATAVGVSGGVTETIDSVGELGVGVLMTLENVIPVIPSEVVLPFAGFTALTLVGAGLWNALFLDVGYQLAERWERVQMYLQPVGYAVAAVFVIGLLVLVARRRQSEQADSR